MSHNPFLTEDTSPEQKIIFKKGQILTVWRKPGCNTFGQTQRLSNTNQYLNDTATTTWHTIGEVYLSVAPCGDPHNDVANTAPEDVSAHCDDLFKKNYFAMGLWPTPVGGSKRFRRVQR